MSYAAVFPSVHFSDSSSDDDSDKCPICLVTIGEQELGTPDSCDHIFCVICLKEWSKIVNICPVDRQVFNAILVTRYPDREIIRRIAVRSRPRRNQYGRIIVQNVETCEECGECDRQERMITCRGCGLVFHLECLDPPLDAIPLEEWFCPNCIMISSLFYSQTTARFGTS
jgi:PHD and RING finger domain-containing protein 1